VQKIQKSRILIGVTSSLVLLWLGWEWRCCVAYTPSPLMVTFFGLMHVLKMGESLKVESYQSFNGLSFAGGLVTIGKNKEASQLLELLLRKERLRTGGNCDVGNISRTILVFRDMDKSNNLSAEEWRTLSAPIKTEVQEIYKYYRQTVPRAASIKASREFVINFSMPSKRPSSGTSISSIFEVLSKRYEDHGCLVEAIQCLKEGILAEKETQTDNSLLYHQLLYQLALLYHKNNMDKEARSVLGQTISLPEAITTIETKDEGFKEEHIKRCQQIEARLFESCHYARKYNRE